MAQHDFGSDLASSLLDLSLESETVAAGVPEDERGAGLEPVGLAPSTALAVRCHAELGLGVFPVDPDTKRPNFKGWQRGGLRQEASIVKVFGKRANEAMVVGVATGFPLAGGGFLYVLDVDGRNGGFEALKGLPPLPETVTAKTKDGLHYWFKTATPQASYRRDGLELKGAGSQVLIPPAPGRSWLRDPWEFEIADCPDFLLPQAQEPKPEKKPLRVVVDGITGELLFDLSDPLGQLRRAKPGSRHQILLSVSARLRLRGPLTGRAYKALLEGALEVGLSESEARRVIDYANAHPCDNWSSKHSSPFPNGSYALTERELRVLRTIVARYETKRKLSDLPFEKLASDVFSLRWICRRTGLDHQEKARRSVEKLVAAGLLWRGGTKRLEPGQRPAQKYRPTYAGLTISGIYGGRT
jgi:Bifunctional DNA primase/polymerase, N-terminal